MRNEGGGGRPPLDTGEAFLRRWPLSEPAVQRAGVFSAVRGEVTGSGSVGHCAGCWVTLKVQCAWSMVSEEGVMRARQVHIVEAFRPQEVVSSLF